MTDELYNKVSDAFDVVSNEYYQTLSYMENPTQQMLNDAHALLVTKREVSFKELGVTVEEFEAEIELRMKAIDKRMENLEKQRVERELK